MQDHYQDAKRTTAQINRLNDMRRLWARLQLAANQLNSEYYHQEPTETNVVKYLERIASTAQARIDAIDAVMPDLMEEHNSIMRKILEGA